MRRTVLMWYLSLMDRYPEQSRVLHHVRHSVLCLIIEIVKICKNLNFRFDRNCTLTGSHAHHWNLSYCPEMAMRSGTGSTVQQLAEELPLDMPLVASLYYFMFGGGGKDVIINNQTGMI